MENEEKIVKMINEVIEALKTQLSVNVLLASRIDELEAKVKKFETILGVSDDAPKS